MIDSQSIFDITSEVEFQNMAFEIFKFQFENNRVYRSYCDLINRHPSDINKLSDIPFLPIQFFKSHTVLSSTSKFEATFTSSGTTSANISKHHITDLGIYENSFSNAFNRFYGNIEDYTILALLPSYLDRSGSSLVYMVNALIKKSKHPESGFYLKNISELKKRLIDLDSKGKRVLLIGVSFALLDFVERHLLVLNNTIVMETGGMKGQRKELVRSELHHILKEGFGVSTIHSEYGMTELLSQAYSKGNGLFKCPPWMKVLTRDTEDPLTILTNGTSGGINVIDLANINSCSFIATQDLGKVYDDGSFEVVGRFDNSDIRGCNLMVL